jgi:hypothetical protein
MRLTIAAAIAAALLIPATIPASASNAPSLSAGQHTDFSAAKKKVKKAKKPKVEYMRAVPVR